VGDPESDIYYRGGAAKDAREGLECLGRPVWWIPEVPYCAAHLPVEWAAIFHVRVKLWTDLAAEIWAEVLADTPLPPLEDEADE
jgi:hypothetical protein